MFFSRANKYGDKCALKVKKKGKYRDISWGEFERNVRELAYGLLSLGLEVEDKVGLLLENRPEWAYSDLAILSIGCIDVPIYTIDAPSQIEYILSDSESKVVIVSNQEQLQKISMTKSRLPHLKKIIIVDPPKENAGDDMVSFEAVTRLGRENAAKARTEFESRSHAIKKEATASIIYTSGTTGLPKGVCLTHDNFLSNCRSSIDLLPLGEHEINLSFLPLSHVLERMASYYFPLFIGGTIAYAENIDSVQQNLREVRPTLICAVPRFYEKMYANVMDVITQSAPVKQKVFNWALKVAKAHTDAKLNKIWPSFFVYVQYLIAKALVFSKLKQALGGRLRFFISGGAPLSKELAEFFYSIGVLILEGYGLTETSPVISCNTVKNFKFGSVGKPIRDVEVKMAPDGEILTKGPNVMKGYYKNEQVTKETIDSDGWLHTGDIGFLDEEGYMHITDRKKDIIITAGGKNIAPQNVENLLKSDSYIQEVVLYGDRKPYVTALIVPNFDALKGLALRQGIPYITIEELVRHPRVCEFIANRMEEKQKDLPRYEKIKKFTLLDRNLTIESGEITPTLKVKRKKVCEKYKEVFDKMYEV
ncbi:MAG: hypothetical protein AMJ78_06325 [Omnitrophica WOR_2 bacterium SM23_29]|nr:MAG: hypothetical protein AMJ78_06325 [Omnitrophica WOR_2 bacterium SM23_29]